MKNKIFDEELNRDIHKSNTESIDKVNDVGAATLKTLLTLVDLLSNLSPTNLPNIASKMTGLANPLIDAAAKSVEVKVKQAETIKDVEKLDAEVELPKLDVENPIETDFSELEQ